MLDKNYAPKEIEAKFYQKWEESGAFSCETDSDKPKYCITMPPPNVTGRLHLGHALTFSLQDILARYHRMKGYDVLWQPGTDHAGIATQMIVEKQLLAQNISRVELGREKFLEKVWEWKAHSGDMIIEQLKRLGSSPDWSRLKFTLDPEISDAVKKVFVDLYHQGLAYKDKRLVNWDPVLQTAVSDLETEEKELKGHMYHIRYPLTHGNGYLTVATTRPETLFGDTAVAVHPEDARYKDLVGQTISLPLTTRVIPIIADTYCDPEKGTGAVKITPAHDFNDFEVGARHNLDRITVIDQFAILNENAPSPFQGMDRFMARKAVIHALEEQGLLEKVEDIIHSIPHGDRSGAILEPRLTDQWYVDAATLAKPALKAVEDGQTTYFPKHWENTYFEWLRNIRPWCVSRQIWWGHRIPAWYGPDGHTFVENSQEEAENKALAHYGQKVDLTQETDVLDTWFSSALWPFTTLGWPEKTKELDKYYPTSVLVTGFDIIFFWVARMMMMGMHFMKEVPFSKIYIHALVRDEKGHKMSKTKGNVLDPLNLCDEYGADALRFTLAFLAAPGRDIRISVSKVENSRNFITKLWNASRYAQMSGCVLVEGFDPLKAKHTLNRWIFSEFVLLNEKLEKAMVDFRFNEVANLLYQFVWGTFCDWYLEFTKPLLQTGTLETQEETKAMIAYILKNVYIVMNPVTPHICEELFESLSQKTGELLITTPWPTFNPQDIDYTALGQIQTLIEIITSIRSARSELNVPASKEVPLKIIQPNENIRMICNNFESLVKKLGRLGEISFEEDTIDLKQCSSFVVGDVRFALILADVIDFEAEKQRLSKEIGKLEKEFSGFKAKLNNPDYIANAPEEVVEETQEKAKGTESKIEKLQRSLSLLG